MTNPRQPGFTLIELILFIVVLSAGLAGILSVMTSVVKSSADPLLRKQATALADAILEEILLKSYAHDGSAPVGSNRATYDNVDDYNGLTQAAFTDLPPELSGYGIACTVAAAASVQGVSMKKVTVSVARGSESVSLSGYRADY